ncbi:IniB N-terminal domain-containing protein [Actinoplanes sp. NPDC051513]|uniref:IniB N-terminal domain-containing protein n=1 Tax=Actinoplanes sp. NPDC051513 TaxID=3363908 RepID=UPI003794A0F7
MDSSPTLQDFVLNLIYDPGARSAFELDPHGTLEASGLGDITAADVQDVLPLVLDYAPLGAVPAQAGLAQVDDVTTGVAHLDVAGAVAHLQSITAQVGGGTYSHTADLNVAAATTVTADQLLSTVDVTGGLGLIHDPAAGLDATVYSTVDHTTADVSYSAESVVSHAAVTGTLDATVNTATGVTGSLGVDAGGLDVSGVHEATSSLAGSLAGTISGVDHTVGGLLPDGTVDGALHGTVGDATGVIDHHVSGVTGLVDGLTHTTPEPAPEPEAGHDLLGGLTGLHF